MDRLKAFTGPSARRLRVEVVEPIGKQFDTDRVKRPDVVENPYHGREVEVALARQPSIV